MAGAGAGGGADGGGRRGRRRAGARAAAAVRGRADERCWMEALAGCPGGGGREVPPARRNQIQRSGHASGRRGLAGTTAEEQGGPPPRYWERPSCCTAAAAAGSSVLGSGGPLAEAEPRGSGAGSHRYHQCVPAPAPRMPPTPKSLHTAPRLDLLSAHLRESVTLSLSLSSKQEPATCDSQFPNLPFFEGGGRKKQMARNSPGRAADRAHARAERGICRYTGHPCHDVPAARRVIAPAPDRGPPVRPDGRRHGGRY